MQVGDIIRAINGIQTNQLRHGEVADILLNSGPVISLQLEFDSAQGRKHLYNYIIPITVYT